jgi:hypothetical protein
MDIKEFIERLNHSATLNWDIQMVKVGRRVWDKIKKNRQQNSRIKILQPGYFGVS